MIPENFIEQWQNCVQWRTLPQIEQDLVISRALVDLYNEPYIKDALLFRGGTALNKLFLKPPARYSEDIDFVQKRPEPIDLDRVFEIYSKYCANDNTHIRGEDFLKNLALKKNHPDFQSDMSSLLPIELNWSFEESYQFVVDNVISRLP